MRRAAPTKRTKHFTQTLCLALAFILVTLAGTPALALDPMGPPASTLRQGDYRLGLDYSFSEMDLELTNGTLTGTGDIIDWTLEDLAAHRAYASLGYGLSDNWEGFLRFGGAQGTFGDTIFQSGEEFDGGIDFAIGAGVKATFYENDLWRLGALLQASYTEFDGTLELNLPTPIPNFTEVDLLLVQAAVGATYRWTDRLCLYAGPFAYMAMGDFEAGFGTAKLRWDLDNSIDYGGYLGADVILGDNCTLSVEYQLAGDASTIGLGLAWRI